MQWAVRIGLGLVALLLLALGGGAWLLWRTLPGTSDRASIQGLSAPVEIRFDEDGVPRIRAANALDAAAALGFVHARDRMLQMDLMRRNAAGRLSEIAGPATLALDRQMRVLGVERSAKADWESLPAPARAMLEAYARGVNAWIEKQGRFAAPEYLFLGAGPRPWQPTDSLLWAKTMGLYLSENYRIELARLALAGHLPPERIGELWPAGGGPGRPQAALAPDVRPDARYAEAARRVLAALPDFPDRFTQPPTASNEWAVDGAHSESGAPLLAGDPHLGFAFPSPWYLARIDTPDGTLAGATAPGVPFLVLGHNGRIAWTFTSTGADVQDVFIETQLDPQHYQTPDGPAAYAIRREYIGVKGAPDELLLVRETRHGPVISDLNPAPGGAVLSVAMANLLPGDIAAQGLLELNQAGSLAEARAAAAHITSPVQNLLAADREGIGLFVTGRIPIRRGGDGSVPVQGDSGAYDWIGFAAGEALPRYVAPASGRLVNANERIAPPDFPVFLGRDGFGDWRARRIRALLDAAPKHSLADFTRMQADTGSVYAAEILPILTALPRPDGVAGRAFDLLSGWDGRMAREAPQPLIFNAWIEAFFSAVLERAGVPTAAAGPRREFVAFVLSPAGAHWCGGDCAPMLRAALERATGALAGRYGTDPAAWRWGDAHPAVFAHPLLSRLPVVGPLGVMSIEAPGDDTTLDRGGTPRGEFTSVQGASYRGAYDLADLDRSRFMLAPGQSGNLLGAHGGNFLVRWRDGDTISMQAEPAHVAGSITLTPKEASGGAP